MGKSESLIKDMDAVVTKYKKEKEEKEQRKKEEDSVVTKKDLETFLAEINKQKDTVVDSELKAESNVQPVRQKQPSRDQQIAYQIWKDSKATSIVCIIAIVLPMITILISMFPGGTMAALVAAFIGLIYPCLIFVKMVSIQTRAHKKYGWKPLFQFQQQPRMMEQQANTNKGNQQEFL